MFGDRNGRSDWRVFSISFHIRRHPHVSKTHRRPVWSGSALLATVAFAQTLDSNQPIAPTWRRPRHPDSSSFQGNWRASKLVGLSVYNDNNESLGSINDLLTDKDGNIKAVVLGVGGFLGVGEHLVAVPFDKVEIRQ